MTVPVQVDKEAVRFFMKARGFPSQNAYAHEVARRCAVPEGKMRNWSGLVSRILGSSRATAHDLGIMAAMAGVLQVPIQAIVPSISGDGIEYVGHDMPSRWEWEVNNGIGAKYYLTIARWFDSYLVPEDFAVHAAKSNLKQYYREADEDHLDKMQTQSRIVNLRARKKASYHHVIVVSDAMLVRCREREWIDMTRREIQQQEKQLTCVLLPETVFQEVYSCISTALPFTNWSKIRIFDDRLVSVFLGMSGFHYFQGDAVRSLVREITLRLLKHVPDVPLNCDEVSSIGTEWNSLALGRCESLLKPGRKRRRNPSVNEGGREHELKSPIT